MHRPFVFIVLTIILISSACITVNVPIGGDPESTATVWTVEPDRMDTWSVSTNYIVQIKDFSSSQSVQGVQMIVLNEDGTINKTATDIWSSRPVELLPDILHRDMISVGAWGAVLRKSTLLPENLVVEGFVREFGGRVVPGGWEAVLDVDVTVLNGDDYNLVFQENYRFHWELSEPSYSRLAGAMNILVEIWCEEVMGDIWSAMLPIR
ncbi:MAG: ABC-type transport auxiliary lipoprotein family protein [Candidatus Aegiribacteria sp.]|nr:ABC-type transport auxiliary lipoprotein family protein [Candidatus Aegiribacteria sp.]